MILEEIAAKTVERIEVQKKQVSIESLKEQIFDADGYQEPKVPFPFEKALSGPKLHFICEVKKASPSKGVIAEHFPYLDIAGAYEQAGADAVSVLTEPYYFQGDNQYLAEIAKKVKIPVLRKDFVIDEYMIYEAKLLGASAVLLICSILKEEQLSDYLQLSHSLGMSALVEAHTEKEVEMALHCNAGIIGVNNRNLKDFTVDVGNSLRLRELVPKDVIFVSESGIRTPDDVEKLREAGVNAVLIGETLMRSENKAEGLKALRG